MENSLNTPKSNTWRNSTMSNYLLLFLRIASVLILTRGLFINLGAEDYGFWALLWSMFGYTLLLDFGFGTAVQKWTSQTRVNGDWSRYGSLLSSLLACYGLMGALIALSSLPIAYWLPQWFHFSGDPRPFQLIFVIFGVGSGLIFPTGLAAEMLRGLEQITLRNRIQGWTLMLQTIGSLLLVQFYPDLLLLTVWTLLTTLGGNLFMLRSALRALPANFKLGQPSRKLLSEVASFSIYAWIITLTNLVIFRSDQLIIGASLGVGAIAGYQIANRLADLFRQLTTQLHDYLGPLAARAYSQGQQTLLNQTMLNTSRWVSLLAVLMGLPLAWFLPELLQLWLKLDSPDVRISAWVLLGSMFVQVSLRSTSTQILLMCQREQTLMWGALAEAFLNLGLSLVLAPRIGILGVALGTLLPNLLLAVVFNLPLASRVSNLNPWQFFRQTSGAAWLAGILATVIFWPLAQMLAPLPAVLRLFGGGLLCAIITLFVLIWLGITASEKLALRQKISKKLYRLSTIEALSAKI
jgi:O-antigen/teichoic acid export membrane protein